MHVLFDTYAKNTQTNYSISMRCKSTKSIKKYKKGE